MALTQPRLAYPVIIAADEDILIVYSDLTSDTATIAAGTYYIQGNTLADCLIQVLEDALNAASPLTWKVTLDDPAAGRVKIEHALGTPYGVSLTWQDGNVYPREWGLALDTTQLINLTTVYGVVEGDYRCRSIWMPMVEDHMDRYTLRDAAVVQTTGAGGGDLDVYSGPKRWHHQLPEVHEVLIRQQYKATAGFVARVSGLTSGDSFAALDGWLRRMHTARSNDALPALRWTKDYTSPGSYRSVWIEDPRMYASIDGWIQGENTGGIPWMDLDFFLTEDES